MNRALAALGLFGILTEASCHDATLGLPPDAGTTDTGRRTPVSTDSGDSPPRCVVTGTISLEDGAEGQDLDVGDAALTGGEALIGVARTARGSRFASIARVGHRDGRASFLDLGPASTDTAPPTPFARDGEVFAVGRVSSGDSGALGATLFRLAFDARQVWTAQPLLTLPPTGPNPSAVAAVAAPRGSPLGAVLAWDEDRIRPTSGDPRTDGADGVRGVIRLALVGADMRTLLRVDVASPELTDAERPRVALRDGGFWVAWLARRTEPIRDAAADLEGPGQERAYQWVEVLALDTLGSAMGPPRRLTSATGHATGFMMDVREPGQDRSPRLDIYAGLDEERANGAGAGITRVTLANDGLPRLAPLLAEGAARGVTPWLLRRPDGTGRIFFVDSGDNGNQVRSILLDADGNPVGAPTLEPGLEDARPLAGTSPSPDGEVLAWTQGVPSTLRWLSCPAIP